MVNKYFPVSTLAMAVVLFSHASFAVNCNGKKATIVLEDKGWVDFEIDNTGERYVTTYSATGGDDVIAVYGMYVIDAKNGNDSICNLGKYPMVARGDAGNDYILGGPSWDTLSGGSGNDYISGKGSDDALWGDSGNDEIRGGDEKDYILGGSGNDKIYGEDGADRINGGTGDDTINGGADNDLIIGHTGSDVIYGGSGDDRILADQARDTILYPNDAEYLWDESDGPLNTAPTWGSGNDYVEGGSGNDIIVGAGGTDTIYGESGIDTLYGNGGKDLLLGGGYRSDRCYHANTSTKSQCDD